MKPVPVPVIVRQARERGVELVSAQAVQRAIDQVSVRLALRLQETNPLFLVVMHGALPYAGELFRRFAFPLEYGYLHASRYGGATRGGELQWHARPTQALTGRTVVLVDDILDRGETLATLRDWAMAAGAGVVLTTVLVDKTLAQPRPIAADFAALACPDRYLFGCGMDFHGYWRNLPAIYALPDDLVEL